MNGFKSQMSQMTYCPKGLLVLTDPLSLKQKLRCITCVTSKFGIFDILLWLHEDQDRNLYRIEYTVLFTILRSYFNFNGRMYIAGLF